MTSARRGRPPSGVREAILRATVDLLRDPGLARFTTKAVAERADVAEASIFYHFGDRPGLVLAAFEAALSPLPKRSHASLSHPDLRTRLRAYVRTLDRFYADSLPIVMAAQADAELRDRLADHLLAFDLGPHRSVGLLANHLAAEQVAGRVAHSADVAAIASTIVAAVFLRAGQRAMTGSARKLQSTERLLDRSVAELACRSLDQ